MDSDVFQIGREWWFRTDWDAESETGDELVGPFDTEQEAAEAWKRYDAS